MSPENIFLLKSMTVHLLKEVGSEPDKLFDERSNTFKVVELITAIEPAHK